MFVIDEFHNVLPNQYSMLLREVTPSLSGLPTKRMAGFSNSLWFEVRAVAEGMNTLFASAIIETE